ncbi:class I SAM-dependent methyltransferase [Humibacter sp.]|uniref:class I SAM-dependent methyltransferase n=1 Tax=Humibacter sp. TaxID=1940291 RepID=UPI002CF0E165|nr:methyltransferase domain-containing protein [Humibacter sp.]HVX09199.1 methyltransferase domain-containing protein [Humibacter sp.]
MSDRDDHNETVKSSFTRQLGIFQGEDSLFATQRELTRQHLGEVTPDDVVLDVACGAAHASEAAAPFVRQVVGIDLTRALLDEAHARLARNGIRNVLLQEGDAADLPFVDDSFDVVACRNSLHHFADPREQVREMARVCRRSGRVVISDMVAPEAGVRHRYDELHRLIDPSHTALLLAEELVRMLEDEVGPVIRHETLERVPVPLDLFLTEQSDSEAVLAALEDELAGGPATGFRPSRDDGRLSAGIQTTVVHARPR